MTEGGGGGDGGERWLFGRRRLPPLYYSRSSPSYLLNQQMELIELFHDDERNAHDYGRLSRSLESSNGRHGYVITRNTTSLGINTWFMKKLKGKIK